MQQKNSSAGGENTISLNALKNISPLMFQAVKRGRKSVRPTIPNPEDLRVGDLILTRHLSQAGSEAPTLISRAQSLLGFSPAGSAWTHVALYVGDLHVVEAQGIKDRTALAEALKGEGNLLAGVQLRPITDHYERGAVQVLRHTSQAFPEVRGMIARYALLDLHLRKRRYGHARAIRTVTDNTSTTAKAQHTDSEIICSEFVLECLAIGGSTMVQEYADFRDGKRKVLPASFFDDDRFAEVSVGMLRVV